MMIANVNTAGGCVDFRTHMEENSCRVETWYLDLPTIEKTNGEESFVKESEKTFASTAEAWQWVGEQIGILERPS